MGNYVFFEDFRKKHFSDRENRKARTVSKNEPLIGHHDFNN